MISHVINGRMRVGLTSRTGNNAHFLSASAGIMPLMDDTPLDSLLSELASADPAEAPDLADKLSEALTEALESGGEEEASAPPA